MLNKMDEWRLPPPLFRNSVNSFQSILLGEKYKDLNNRQIKIMDHLVLNGNLTIKDCLKILKGVRRITINTDLKKLKDLGIIKKMGASVSTYYVIAI